MPTRNDDLKARLSRYDQIKISIIGRKSGRTISIPVWFVLEGKKLYLLPVQGSGTQWYRNVRQNPSIRIDTRGVFRPTTSLSTLRNAIPATTQNSVRGCELGFAAVAISGD